MNQAHFASLDLNLLRVFDASHGGAQRHPGRGPGCGLPQSAISHALIGCATCSRRAVRARRRRHAADRAGRRDRPAPAPGARSHAAGAGAVGVRSQDHRTAASRSVPATISRALLLPEITARLRVEAPHAELRVRAIDDIDIVEELDAGRMDLVTGAFGRIPERFAQEAALSRRDGVGVARRHPAAGKTLTLELIAGWPHLSGRAGRQRVGGDRRFHHPARARAPRHRLQSRRRRQGAGRARPQPAQPRHGAAFPWRCQRVLLQSDLIAMLPRRLAARFTGVYPLTLIAPPLTAPRSKSPRAVACPARRPRRSHLVPHAAARDRRRARRAGRGGAQAHQAAPDQPQGRLATTSWRAGRRRPG